MNQVELVLIQGLAKASLKIGRVVGEHCVRPQTEYASKMVGKESNLTVLLRDGKNLYLAEGLKRRYAVAHTLNSSERCFPIKAESCYLELPGEKPKHIVGPDKDAIIRGEW